MSKKSQRLLVLEVILRTYNTININNKKIDQYETHVEIIFFPEMQTKMIVNRLKELT